MLRRTSVFALVLALACAATAAAQAKQADSLQLTLPPACYAVVGVPMSVYYDNIVLTEKPEDYRFQVKCDVGTSEARRWTVTPAAGDVGDHPWSVCVNDAQGKKLAEAKMVLRVSPANAGAGRSIRLLIVGDSLTHATAYPNEIARLLSQPDNPQWTMLGTHRPASAAKGVAHEGYGGWTWGSFVSRYVAKPNPAKAYDRSSPFLFPSPTKPVLDLPRYFKTACGGQVPDFVTVMLGINDCFSAKPDDPLPRIQAMFVQADRLIAEFRKAAPKAQLGICLVTPPNARESGFQANYKGKYPRWGWKRIQHRLVQEQMKHFGGRESEQIFLVPTELNLDPVDGYPVNNGVHPNKAGYDQVGASIYAWLKSRLRD